jgi:hypothetical protein
LTREHALLAAASGASARTVDQVILVTAFNSKPLSEAIAAATGAKVSVWKRADAGNGPLPAGAPSEDGLVERVVSALAGVTAAHILLVIGPSDGRSARIDVIPLVAPGRSY